MRLRALILLFALPARAAAQDSSVVLWTRETVHSATLKGDRQIYVATPNGYRNDATRRYPVLVILDAEDTPQFNLALANVAFLADRGAIPQLIVVGIPNGSDRSHDLTPPATGNSAREFPTAGGGHSYDNAALRAFRL
jgi:predicted alpha/beta superfamily hydrolase